MSVRLGVFTSSLLTLCLAPTLSADPVWWTTGPTPLIHGNETGTTNNYAPANLGQLKNFADQAKAHLDQQMHGLGGAGLDIQTMTDGWTSAADSYLPINLGQLKSVVDKFYTRLDVVHFDYKSQLISTPNLYGGIWTGNPPRPWNVNTALTDNYAPVNLGQLKILFSFDLSKDGPDALPDWWEKYYFNGTTGNPPAGDSDGDGLTNLQEYQQGTNPNDFWNGQPPVFVKVKGDNQSGPPNAYVSLPLTVRVQNAQGKGLSNASVTFSVVSGGGTLQLNSASAGAATVTRSTDATGVVQVYFKLPNTANANSTITATFGSPAQTVSFAEQSETAASEVPSSPFGPLNLVAQNNADGSTDLTWDTNPDAPDTGTPIWQLNNNVWVQVGTAPVGATSYHIPAP